MAKIANDLIKYSNECKLRNVVPIVVLCEKDKDDLFTHFHHDKEFKTFSTFHVLFSGCNLYFELCSSCGAPRKKEKCFKCGCSAFHSIKSTRYLTYELKADN